jgi:hypothetical protein
MPSPIEQLYLQIFGSLPAKSGAAFERLAAIAMHVLSEGNVLHDARIRGQFSKTLYQIDAHHRATDGSKATMAEAKDYSARKGKVGRADLQKLGGALPDLKQIDQGAFFSSTGYTKPAKKYADNASAITGGKPISLYELAASTEEDEKGFIKTIVINIHLEIPEPERGSFTPVLTPNAQQQINEHLVRGGKTHYGQTIGELLSANGRPKLSLSELTSRGYGAIHSDDSCAHACYWLPDHYIDVDGLLSELRGLEYKVPYTRVERRIEISDDSTHRIVLRDKDGNPLKLLSDKALRKFAFDEDGHLVPPRI